MSAIVKAGAWSLQPTTFAELKEFCVIVADSELVPKDYRGKPGNVLVAIQMGADIGLAPMQAIQNIAVINGRPSLWGDAMLAVCLPHCAVAETFDEKTMTATCTVTRDGQVTVRTFSQADAVKAKLWTKAGPWTDYPKRMLQMRARGFALRDTCPDILRGINSAEEQSDIVVIAPAAVKREPAPTQPTAAPTPAAEKPLVFVWKMHPLDGKPVVGQPAVVLTAYLHHLDAMVIDPSKPEWKPRIEAHRKRVEAVYESLLKSERDAKLDKELQKLGQAPAKMADESMGVDRMHDEGPESWGLAEPPADYAAPVGDRD